MNELMNSTCSIRVVYENEVSILSQRVCKFSEKFKDKLDMLHTLFS